MWTTPYLGYQHLLEQPTSNGRWATVDDRGSYVELSGWYKGCGFSPYDATFDTIEEARAAGEKWVTQGVFPPNRDK